MEQMKPHQNMTYYTLPEPVFYVDSGSEVRIPVFYLWHLIFCLLMVQMINSAIADVSINFQGIASDRNSLVTYADFDYISPIFGNIMTHNIMQYIEHITFDGYSKGKNSLPQNSNY